MIKISHETPRCLLRNSIAFNNYQYALAHLLEKDEEYREHFLWCKDNGIEIYLDNSLHELGYALDDETLIKWIDILRPSTFFVPDVWCDKNRSVVNAKRWSHIALPDGVEKTAVVQANSLSEACMCTTIYKDLGYKKIAYSYGADFYAELFPHPNRNTSLSMGRALTIAHLYRNGFLQDTDNVHLLGTACVAEFPLYKNYPFIKSVDTSNPIMAAIDGVKYTNGMHEKPRATMNSHYDVKIQEVDLNLLDFNVNAFKILINN